MKEEKWAREMTHCIEKLLTKPDNQSSIPWTHMVEEEN